MSAKVILTYAVVPVVFFLIVLGTSGFFDSVSLGASPSSSSSREGQSVIVESRDKRRYGDAESLSAVSAPTLPSLRKRTIKTAPKNAESGGEARPLSERAYAGRADPANDHPHRSSSRRNAKGENKVELRAKGPANDDPNHDHNENAASTTSAGEDPPLPLRELHHEEKHFLQQQHEHSAAGTAAAAAADDDFEHPKYHGNPYSKHCQLPTAVRGRGTVKAPARIALDPSSSVAANMKMLFDESLLEKNIREGVVVPTVVTPTFKDGDVLRSLLQAFDTPVRHFVFVCNSDDDKVAALMKEIQPLEMLGAVTIFPYKGFNRGFSTSINLGYRRAREILFGKSEYAFLPAWPQLAEVWYFAINCDAIFRKGAAEILARGVFKEVRVASAAQRSSGVDQFGMSLRLPSGLFYGNVVDHYAFGVTQAAIDEAGFFDEVYFPGYNEDIDFQWRVHIAGFRSVSFPAARIDHHQSINLKRAGGQSLYRQQIHRHALGFEYGWMKYGVYQQVHTRLPFPPSGRKTLFGIPGFPLHLWRVDPAHRRCIVTGQGTYFVKSSTCWYNGSVLLEWLPKGTRLPKYMRQPTESLRDFLGGGSNNSRWE